uniref:Uncharacterized protein n=1 Tax=Sphaerodactylus townsendi TaxID=933632 RepID=A0ACB8FED4_9SAUR
MPPRFLCGGDFFPFCLAFALSRWENSWVGSLLQFCPANGGIYRWSMENSVVTELNHRNGLLRLLGATREIGSALTRMCMRHRSIESKLRQFSSALIDCLINPLQEQMEEWKKAVNQLDKDHAKVSSPGQPIWAQDKPR